jgi:hypothetical protein
MSDVIKKGGPERRKKYREKTKPPFITYYNVKYKRPNRFVPSVMRVKPACPAGSRKYATTIKNKFTDPFLLLRD